MKTNPSNHSVTRSAFLRIMALGLPMMSVAASDSSSVKPAADQAPVPDPANLRTFVELARSDIRTQKALIVAQNMTFSNDEAVEFWPVEREYELELSRLQDQRLELIKRYASQYEAMTDADATKLANDVFDIEARRTDLKRKYFKKFSKVVPALKAARFFQIENQLNMVIDLQVAAALPLIK
jgi:hypothetical protein